MDTALVTGGTGFIGANVVRTLLNHGVRVRVLVRPRGDRSNLAGLELETVEGDLLRPASLQSAVRGVRWVFHAAASYTLWSSDPKDVYAVNVEGTRALLEAAGRSGVERIVYTSSVATVGLRKDEKPSTEEEPLHPGQLVGHYKRSKYLAEREVLGLAKKGLPVVVVNPSAPVGPWDVKPTPTGRILLDFLNRRMPAYVRTGLNWVSVQDVAEGHWLAARRGRLGERYILGHQNLYLKEILDMLGEISGLSVPQIRLPYGVAFLAGCFSTAWAALSGREPRVPLDGVRMARHIMFFDPGKAVAELGLPQTPVHTALRQAVEWFCQNHYVNPIPAKCS